MLEAVEALSGENEKWMAGFGASFKIEKDPECLELIFCNVKPPHPHITFFPLPTVYFPITLRADSTNGEHLKSLLKDAFKRISEFEESGIVFKFLVERLEAGSTYAIMDALDCQSGPRRILAFLIYALSKTSFFISSALELRVSLGKGKQN